MTTVFHGTERESSDLLKALQRNCECKYAESGARVSACPGHRALYEDQKFLDRLLFERWNAATLSREEGL